MIVKPCSNFKSKPLSQQTPKSNLSPQKMEKMEKEGFGVLADTKITKATTYNYHPSEYLIKLDRGSIRSSPRNGIGSILKKN